MKGYKYKYNDYLELNGIIYRVITFTGNGTRENYKLQSINSGKIDEYPKKWVETIFVLVPEYRINQEFNEDIEDLLK